MFVASNEWTITIKTSIAETAISSDIRNIIKNISFIFIQAGYTNISIV